MRILVTGGAGYIGSVLVRYLLNCGHEVRVLDSLFYGGSSIFPLLDNHSFEFIFGDLRSPEILEKSLAGMEVVIHLAAIVGDPASKRFPLQTKKINYDCSLSLIKRAEKLGIKKFIFVSTCSNYGAMKDPDSFVDENAPLRPLSLYAQTKVDVEKFLLTDCKSSPMIWTILRFATAHGLSPRMRLDLTVNEFAYILALGLTLEIYGGHFWRPYCHVQDFSKCIGMILEKPEDLVGGQVFNVGSEAENYQKVQLVDIIREFIPETEVKIVPQTEDPRNYRVSFEKIRNIICFNPDHCVRDSVRNIIFACKNHLLEEDSGLIYSNIDPRIKINRK